MELENQIRQLITADLEKEKILVDDVEYLEEDNTNFLRIVIDKEGVVDIDTCVLATRIINPILDTADLIEENYILDITSKEKGE